MKRAKLILTSLVLLAVVGGVLAFKAKNPVYCLYTTNPAAAITCPKLTTIENTKPGSQFLFATTRPILNCPTAVPVSHCTSRFEVIVE